MAFTPITVAKNPQTPQKNDFKPITAAAVDQSKIHAPAALSASQSLLNGITQAASTAGQQVKDASQDSAKGAIQGGIETVKGLTELGGGIENAISDVPGLGGLKQANGAAKGAAELTSADNNPGLEGSGKTGGKVLGELAVAALPVGEAAKAAGVADKVAPFANKIADALGIGVKKETTVGVDAAKKLEPIVKAIMPKLTPKETQEAVAAGRTSEGMLGKVNITPQSNDYKVAQDISNVEGFNPSNTKARNIRAVRSAVEKEATGLSDYLANNKVMSNFEDFRNYISNKVKPSSSLKGLDSDSKAAQNTYNKVRESLISSVEKHLKNTGNTGSMTDMSEFWDARKGVDQQIEDELGAKTFDSPQYKGAKAAAQDFRNAMNGFVSDSLSNPGTMSTLNTVNDFISESAARGISFDNVEDLESAVKEQLGVKSLPEDVAKAAYFRNSLGKMSNFYKAIDDMSTWAGKEVGSNKIGRFVKAHPVAATVGGLAAEQAGVGIAKKFINPGGE